MVVTLSMKIKNYFSCVRAIFHFLLPLKKESNQDYLSIAAAIKDEAPYLQEWIEYHKMLGVSRFYLYDAATDNSKEILARYIENGDVIYHEAKGRGVQIPIYNDVLCRYREKSHWIAFIDVDEYIGLEEPYETIPSLLSEFEAYPGIGINWVMYDSNGHVSKPDGLIIKNYTRVYRDDNNQGNLYIKSIINPKKALCSISAHWFIYNPFRKRRWAVNENYIDIIGAFTKSHSTNKARIAHYYSKSRDEFIQKCRRGCVNSTDFISFSEQSYNFIDTKQDASMLKYVDKLEKIFSEMKH